MRNILRGILITTVYYVVIYFIIIYAFKSFPAAGGPSEAVFIMFGLALLSVILLIYNLVKLIKGDWAQIYFIITHIIAMIIVFEIVSNH
ncbi:hypothetical protein [Flavobacterium fluviale]|uniref:Uncharacterized protein n=1 Tax=Flavobacterium fluviale TaxID=2249356 RepID=A0A344LWM7_9FLAO|nr:hypothetical protein [Flavobacterium fluviale]AXB58319.1 hypothetical protein HYN86_17645 [Flavobacterium fluviale]